MNIENNNVVMLAERYSCTELVAAVVLKTQPGNDPRSLPVTALNLSQQTLNCLRRGGIRTFGELIEHTADGLVEIRGFGQKSLDQISEVVALHGHQMAGLARS